MDSARFDALAKTIASSTSRRRILAGLAGSALGFLGPRSVDARTCAPLDVICREDANCCSGLCGDADRRGRRRCACQTPEDCPPPDECHAATCIDEVCGQTQLNTGTPCDTGVCFQGSCCTPRTCGPTDCGWIYNNCGSGINCGRCASSSDICSSGTCVPLQTCSNPGSCLNGFPTCDDDLDCAVCACAQTAEGLTICDDRTNGGNLCETSADCSPDRVCVDGCVGGCEFYTPCTNRFCAVPCPGCTGLTAARAESTETNSFQPYPADR